MDYSSSDNEQDILKAAGGHQNKDRPKKKKKKSEDQYDIKPELASCVLNNEEIQHIIDLGLGRGVDATIPSPWLNKTSFQVRDVHAGSIIGTEEGGVLQSYSEEVSSVQSMQTNLSSTVPAGKDVSIGVDAELSRSYSKTRRSIGKKIVNRTISFRADFDDLLRQSSFSPLQEDGDEVSLNTFEQRLCKWILEKMEDESKRPKPEIGAGESHVDHLIKLFDDTPDSAEGKTKRFCREFINSFHTTHYVISIKLGASQHRVMSEEDYQSQVSQKGSLDVARMANSALEPKTAFGIMKRAAQVTEIGRMSKGSSRVQRGTLDEAVVGVTLKPISTLIKFRHLRNILEEAIKDYIEHQENNRAGPFLISCNDETIYLMVDDFQVVGTTDLNKASEFFIRDDDDPFKFSIMHSKRSRVCGVKTVPRFLCASVNSLGHSPGPLTLRLDAKDTKTKMMLGSRHMKHFRPVEIKDWVNGTEIFYINLKKRSMQGDSYLCVKPKDKSSPTSSYTTCCVSSINMNKKDNHFMLFRLLRPAHRREHYKQKSKEWSTLDTEDNRGYLDQSLSESCSKESPTILKQPTSVEITLEPDQQNRVTREKGSTTVSTERDRQKKSKAKTGGKK